MTEASDTSTLGTYLLGGDMPVRRIGFGAMRLALDGGFSGADRSIETAHAVLGRALEIGVNHIDTAEFYRNSDGSVAANALIRQALTPYPADLVIATKVGPVFGPSGVGSAAPGELRSQVEANLQSLGLDRLDLVYLRIGAADIPHQESVSSRFEVLAALREEGLIRHLGISNVTIDHLGEAQRIAPVVAVQNDFHAAKRDDIDLLDACTQSRVAFIPYFPLGGGQTDINLPKLVEVAREYDATVSQVALAWLLALSPNTLAIPGTGSVPHLEENVGVQGQLAGIRR